MNGYGVSAGCVKLDQGMVSLVGKVAILVADSKVNEVAGLDLVGGSPLGNSLLLLLVLFVDQFLGKGFFLLLILRHDAAGRIKLGIGGYVDFVGGHHVEAKILLEILGVIDGDDVTALQLKYPIVRRDLPKCSWNLSHEEPLPSTAANQVNGLLVAAGQGGNADGDTGMSSADAEIAVLHHNRQGDARFVPTLGFLP